MVEAASMLPLRRANIAAMNGEDSLVPPHTPQLDELRVAGPYTATPVLGSALAEMSASMRPPQASVTPVCQLGLGWPRPQPLPAPFHADSDQPRVLPLRTRLVPPTATAPGAVAGHCAP